MSYSFASAGLNYNFPATVGGTGVAAGSPPAQVAKIFPAPSTNNGVVSVVPASLRILAQQQGQVISVIAAGNLFVHGTSPTVNFVLQNGTSLTAASNSTILTLASAQSLTTNAWYPYVLKAELQGDNASGVLQVVSGSIVCNGVSGSVTATDLTGISFDAKGSSGEGEALNLVFGVLFTVSDAQNSANLYQFGAGEQ